MLGDGEDRKKHYAENHACDRGLILGEEIDNGGGEKHRRDDEEPERNFSLADVKIAWNLPLAVAGLGETEHQHRQRLHGETPDHTKSVERRQLVDIAAA